MQDPKDTTDPLKPDLKHDSMEFNAATEGDDILDTDIESGLDLENELISAEELDYLEEDKPDNKAEALNTAENDRLADDDNFLTEEDQEETYDQPDPANDADENE